MCIRWMPMTGGSVAFVSALKDCRMIAKSTHLDEDVMCSAAGNFPVLSK